ncbi:MAG TPA: phosphate ABC transporter permease subunit PstC, partial [Tepidimicrobium sp.]|nr:phosphate ABC transporter permease subunit PstC [Tepidimicrobium sp.]
MGKAKKDKILELILFFCALISLSMILLMGLFVLKEGYPIMEKVGVKNFLLGKKWSPSSDIYGIFPMILGTVAITVGALILGVPTSVMTAVFLTEFVPKKMEKLLNPAIELLAGIPSVIYGLFGMTTIVPLVREFEKTYFYQKGREIQSGYSLFAAVIILSIMISPTIINISKDALKAVDKELKEGSLALGATQWETIRQVVIPSAKSGIFAGVVLGMGRAIGETMAVIMVAGNSIKIPNSIFSPIRTLTSNIAIEISYASEGNHTEALFIPIITNST